MSIGLEDIKSKIADIMYASDVKEKIIEHYNGIQETGIDTGFFPLNGHFSWLPGDVTVFGGIAGHGKSTLAMYLSVLKSSAHDNKWVFFSPENNPPQYFYEELMFMYLRCFPRSKYVNEAGFTRAFNFVNEHYFFCYPENEPPTPGLIHDRFDKCFMDYGVKGFVTDPFNQLERDMMKSQRDDQYLSAYLSDAKRYAMAKEGDYIIVTHPDKASVGRKKDSIDRECPDEYCMAGGAMWPNKVDNIIIVHRPVKSSCPDSTEVLINIAKIKKHRIVGRPGRIIVFFNKYKNIFEESDETFGGAAQDNSELMRVDNNSENPF